jgi:large subunit ribosomal protein L4
MTTPKSTIKKEKKAFTPIELPVYSMEGKKVGSLTLPESVFGQPWKSDLVHQVTTAMQANKRQSRAHTKDRSEVSGGGKKPWKQKGTGQARHSSTRSPIWRHGGITFGPRTARDYSEKINKKMRAKALYTVLSRTLADGRLLLVDSITLPEIKTKSAVDVVAKLAGIEGFEKMTSKKATAVVIALAERNELVEKSFANIPTVTVVLAKDLNAVSAMHARTLVMVNPEAIMPSLIAKIK